MLRKFKKKTLNEIADMICGNFDQDKSYFIYRSSSYLTEFFEDCGFDCYIHDGSTRKWWVVGVLEDILSKPANSHHLLSDGFIAVIRELMDRSDALNEGPDRQNALQQLNISLNREGFEAFYDEANVCQLRNIETKVSSIGIATPQRAWTPEEREIRSKLQEYFDNASEDEITEDVLLPMFRQLGFQRITAVGHKDKALEYGKDVWMKYRLPTFHTLYFGIQVKKGKLDAAAKSKNTNIAELYAEVQMMLGHVVFDPETNKKCLVDHAIIIAGGEITKQAKNWLGGKLNASQRSQILFMDRNDILDLMLIYKVPLPEKINKTNTSSFLEDDVPF
ncbi:hypothetical protein [Desulfolithobacter sp.]